MSITIHNIDKELDTRLSEEARNAGFSKNKLIKKLLADALGLPSEEGPAEDYREFCGLWSDGDEKEFEQTQTENRQVDPDDC